MDDHLSIVTEAVKLAPPVTTITLNIFGIPVPEVVQVLTMVYAILLVLDRGYRFYRLMKSHDYD